MLNIRFIASDSHINKILILLDINHLNIFFFTNFCNTAELIAFHCITANCCRFCNNNTSRLCLTYFMNNCSKCFRIGADCTFSWCCMSRIRLQHNGRAFLNHISNTAHQVKYLCDTRLYFRLFCYCNKRSFLFTHLIPPEKS